MVSPEATTKTPGLVVILGSGESGPAGRRALQIVRERLPVTPAIVVLDSPAAFQPNCALVAEKVASFARLQLEACKPAITVVSTPRAAIGTADEQRVLAALASASCIMAGPGSPSYMVRELAGTAYLDMIRQAHQRGSTLFLSSAASAAAGALTLPVYEIFKAGFAPHWLDGLDLLRDYGLRLAVIPHWDNHEGGADLDTRCCFMGQARFDALARELPDDVVVLGIDEHTAAVLEIDRDVLSASGKGAVHILSGDSTEDLAHGETISLSHLRGGGPAGAPRRLAAPMPVVPVPEPVTMHDEREHLSESAIERLLAIRSQLRDAKEWTLADAVRDLLAEAGVAINDGPAGTTWSRT